MDIKLGKQQKIITQEEKSVNTDTVTVERIVFLPDARILRVFTNELPHPIETIVDENNADLAIVLTAIENIVKTTLTA